MDRVIVSDLTLSWLIGHFTVIQQNDTTLEKMTSQEVVDALLELRERRAKEKAPYDGEQCPYCKWYHDPRLACQAYMTRGYGA